MTVEGDIGSCVIFNYLRLLNGKLHTRHSNKCDVGRLLEQWVENQT